MEKSFLLIWNLWQEGATTLKVETFE